MNLNKHRALCKICQHPLKEEIELSYLHCVPYRTIQRLYNLYPRDISKHASATGLEKERNRTHFYWRFLEQFKFKKITPSDALRAAIQLDKLEGKLKPHKFSPAKIEVIYNHTKDLEK